jgi:glycosyltransferase involved in cell wall biosynthesis
MATGRNTDPVFHLLESRAYPALLSIVIPMYNEESVAEPLRAELERFMYEAGSDTEVILVNDGSSDQTLPKIVAWAKRDERIKVLHLSRNFGHQAAASAGLDHARGDAVVLIDADLQDPLPVIHEMVERYREGYDVVYGKRERRQGESWFKRFSAWLFYRLMRAMVYRDLPLDAGDFRLMSRQFLGDLKTMNETHRFLRGMTAWVGYPQCAVTYERARRASGRTKYSLRKMLAFAWTAATSFSSLPLQASLIMGAAVGVFAAEEGIRALLATLFHWYIVPGWTSLMVVTSVIGSALLTCMGILGQYVARIYEQAKERPLYLVARSFNMPGADGAVTRAFPGSRGAAVGSGHTRV